MIRWLRWVSNGASMVMVLCAATGCFQPRPSQFTQADQAGLTGIGFRPLAAASSRPAESAPPGATGAGALCGRVIHADADTPMRDEVVVAFPAGPGRVIPERELDERDPREVLRDADSFRDSIHFVARSNAQGEYSVPNLAAGDYVVCLLPTRGPILRRNDVHIADGKVATVDFDVRQRPFGFVTGVLHGLDGTVLRNTPINVAYGSSNSAHSKYFQAHDWRTNADGRFYVPLKDIGEQLVNVWVVGTGRAVNTFKLTEISHANPEIVFTLKPFERRKVLSGAELQGTGTINGVVLLPDGRTPAAGVSVIPYADDRQFFGTVIFDEGDDVDSHLGATVLPTRTAADGSFVVSNLPTGKFNVLVDAAFFPGFAAICGVSPAAPAAPANLDPGLAKTLPTLSRTVDLKDGQKVTGLRVVMEPAGMVSGVLRDAKTGLPVADASVDIVDRGVNTVLFGRYYKPVPFGTTEHRATTDEDGRFQFQWVPPRQYIVRAERDQYVYLRQDHVDVKAGQETKLDLRIQPSGEPLYDGPVGSIAGNVFMPDGKTPAVGVTVGPYTQHAFFPGTNHRHGEYRFRLNPRVVTGTDGSFVIDNLPEGTYGVMAAPHYHERSEDKYHPVNIAMAHSRATLSNRVPVKGGQQTYDLRIVLQSSGAVELAIRDARTGKPIGRAAAYPSGPATGEPEVGSRSWYANDDGHVILPGLTPRWEDISIHAQGYESQEKRGVRVKAAETTSLQIRLRPR